MICKNYTIFRYMNYSTWNSNVRYFMDLVSNLTFKGTTKSFLTLLTLCGFNWLALAVPLTQLVLPAIDQGCTAI